MTKTLNNTTANHAQGQVSDLEVWGTGDLWRLICKASSKSEGWMKSTKAMEVFGGCLVQVTTQQLFDVYDTAGGKNTHHAVAEAVAFVPGVHIVEYETSGGDNGKKTIICRALMPGVPQQDKMEIKD